jgi:hypothetical protein
MILARRRQIARIGLDRAEQAAGGGGELVDPAFQAAVPGAQDRVLHRLQIAPRPLRRHGRRGRSGRRRSLPSPCRPSDPDRRRPDAVPRRPGHKAPERPALDPRSHRPGPALPRSAPRPEACAGRAGRRASFRACRRLRPSAPRGSARRPAPAPPAARPSSMSRGSSPKAGMRNRKAVRNRMFARHSPRGFGGARTGGAADPPAAAACLAANIFPPKRSAITCPPTRPHRPPGQRAGPATGSSVRFQTWSPRNHHLSADLSRCPSNLASGAQGESAAFFPPTETGQGNPPCQVRATGAS